MRLLAAIHALFAAAFLLAGIPVLLGLGITGLIFFFFGAVFAALAGIAQHASRLATAAVLAADAVLMWKAAVYWAASTGVFEHAVAGMVMVLVAAGAVGVMADWRSLCRAPWL
jgi:succinate dehydrogenase/fumarate reductase cytochrome b subunit